MINKVLKDFVPILMEKISEMNSRAKEISLDTLISIFNHPAADVNILIKDIVKTFREDPLGKNQPADKQPARLVLARTEVAIKALESLPIDKSKSNVKEILDLLAIPSLFHANYEVRMGAVELLGQLFKYIGERTLLTI
jgi:centrosomal protein CEP104